MPLSLNGWPPIASHIVALLTGVSLANLSAGEHINHLASALPRKGDLLLLQIEKSRVFRGEIKEHVKTKDPEAAIPAAASAPVTFVEGRYYIVRRGKLREQDCLVGVKPLDLRTLDDERVVVSGGRGQESTLLSLVEIFAGKDSIDLFSNRPQRPICQPQNLVRYDD